MEGVKSNGVSSQHLAVHHTIQLHLGHKLRKGERGKERGERERERPYTMKIP